MGSSAGWCWRGPRSWAGSCIAGTANAAPLLLPRHQAEQGIEPRDRIVEFQQHLLFIEPDWYQLRDARADPGRVVEVFLHVLVVLREFGDRAPHAGAELRIFLRQRDTRLGFEP